MFTCFMYGNYTSNALKEISADRTRLVVTGIAFSTTAALPIEEFDAMMEDL